MLNDCRTDAWACLAPGARSKGAVRAVEVVDTNLTLNFQLPPSTTNMKTIDHLSFPHIIDLCFSFAPIDSLDVMRWVCREWRQRVEAEFYHLRDFSVAQHSVARLYRFQFENRDCLSTPVRGAWTSAKVVDLDSEASPHNDKAVYSFDTIRIPYSSRLMPGEDSLTPFSSRRLVPDDNFSLNTRNRVEKLVIDFREMPGHPFLANQFGIECSSPSFAVGHLVFIVHSTNNADWYKAVDTGRSPSPLGTDNSSLLLRFARAEWWWQPPPPEADHDVRLGQTVTQARHQHSQHSATHSGTVPRRGWREGVEGGDRL